MMKKLGSAILLSLTSNGIQAPKKHRYDIPPEEWQSIRRRVLENREPLRQVAGDYGVSYETVQRVILATHKQAN
jgi:hypothetical protein